MPGTAVGLYCAVVERFDLLVSTRTIAARETRAVFNQRAGSLRTWLGAAEPWFSAGLAAARRRPSTSG